MPCIIPESARRTEAAGSTLLLLYQRTSAFRKRSESLLSRGGSDQLVVIPRPFGFGRLLDLEQISGVNLAAVRADRAPAEQRIVRRHRLHLVDHLDAIVRIAAHRLQRLEVVDQARIDAGLHHRWLGLVLRASGK